jgi:hypothetical protein
VGEIFIVNQEKSQVGYLERWDLPFSNNISPSVCIIPPEDFNRVKVIVMPKKGLPEQYPGYLLDFQSAPFFKFYDETCAPPLIPQWFDLLKAIPKSSTVIWHDSPLVKQYAGIGGGRYYAQYEKLRHYIILGGDSIIEVLAYEEPSIKQFNERQKLTIEYSF